MTLLYAGVEVNPIVEHIAKGIKPDKLSVLIDTVLDYTTSDGINIYPTLISILKSFMEPKFLESCTISNFLRNMGLLDFKIPDCDLILSLLITLGLEKKGSYKDVIDDLRKKLEIETPIIPITNLGHNLEITLDVQGEKKVISPLQYYTTDQEGEIADIFFGNLEENEINEEAKKAIFRSHVLIICQPDPLALFSILNNPDFKKILEEYSGKVVAICQNKLTDKQINIMKALGQSPTVFGLINMYLNLVDVLVLDEKDTEIIVKASAQELGMEIVPIDLDTSEEEKHKKILRKILKVLDLEKSDILQSDTASGKIKQSLTSTADSIKSGFKKIKEKLKDKE